MTPRCNRPIHDVFGASRWSGVVQGEGDSPTRLEAADSFQSILKGFLKLVIFSQSGLSPLGKLLSEGRINPRYGQIMGKKLALQSFDDLG